MRKEPGDPLESERTPSPESEESNKGVPSDGGGVQPVFGLDTATDEQQRSPENEDHTDHWLMARIRLY